MPVRAPMSGPTSMATVNDTGATVVPQREGSGGPLIFSDPPRRSPVACALITGITGQDGQYLAELLHEKAYTVFGLVKGQANPKAETLQRELPFVEIIHGDLQDLPSLVQAL